jgi:predicted outer membrane repeat protein
MKDSSSVAGNSATQSGGGIYSYGDDSAVTMLEGSMVSGNTADADDSGFGSGGGIYGGCGSYLTGAVGDANVDANHKGVASPVENNVHYIPCG